MKKFFTGTFFVSTLVVIGAMVAQPVKADILFGVYGEVQYWAPDTTGGFGAAESFPDYNFDDKNQLRLSLAIQHAVPLLPNIRIESQDMKANTPGTGEGNIGLPGEMDLSHKSAILYYTLFDNSLVRLHAGIAAKRFDGYVQDRAGNSWDLSETVPTAYGLIGAGLPFSGLSVYARGHFMAIGSNSIRDIEAAIQYRLFDTALFDGSVQLGYRHFNVELDDVDGLYSDVTFKGPFVGFQLHF